MRFYLGGYETVVKIMNRLVSSELIIQCYNYYLFIHLKHLLIMDCIICNNNNNVAQFNNDDNFCV